MYHQVTKKKLTKGEVEELVGHIEVALLVVGDADVVGQIVGTLDHSGVLGGELNNSVKLARLHEGTE